MAPLFKCRSNRPSHQSQKTGEANLTPKSPLFCLAHPKKTDESIKLLLQRGPIHGQGQAVVAVGGQEEDGPAIHLLCHMDVLLTLHPHGVRLVPKALDVIVDIVDSLAQLCKVMDLVEMEIAINTCGPGGCMWRPHAASVCFKPLHESPKAGNWHNPRLSASDFLLSWTPKDAELHTRRWRTPSRPQHLPQPMGITSLRMVSSRSSTRSLLCKLWRFSWRFSLPRGV